MSISRDSLRSRGFDFERTAVMGLVGLSSLTDVKVGDIQSVEVLGAGLVLVVLGCFAMNRWVVVGTRPWLQLLFHAAIILSLVGVLGVAAQRLPVYPPPGTSLLKSAPYLTMARLVQLSVAVSGMLIVARLSLSRPGLLLMATQVYVGVAVAQALYALASWVGLYVLGVDLGGAYDVSGVRAKGLFFEGGPFGVYLVSAIVMLAFRYSVQRAISKGAFAVFGSVLVLALIASASKAGVLLVACLYAFYVTFVARRISLAPVVLIVILFVASAPFLYSLRGYVAAYMSFETALSERPDDPSLVMGRGMALILAPIMIADHPLTGVGLGNYSLQRNNPEYLDGLPTTRLWDLHGLGLIGYMAELGIPLTLYVVWFLWRPVALARRCMAPQVAVLCGAYQLFAHLLGVQLTFAYPWLVSGIVLGYALQRDAEGGFRPRETLQ